MIKQMVEWEGFDGQQATRTAYFNLTRFEIAHDMELEILEERFKRFNEEVVEGDERPLTPPEIREMLNIFKVLIKHSFGIRSQDGKRFIKNDEVWNEFVETGCFDAFIFHMFEDAKRANSFMMGIWPKEVQEAADKVRKERPKVHAVPDLDSMDEDTNVSGERDDMGLTVDPQVAPDDNIPSITTIGEDSRPWDKYTEDELIALNDIQFEKVLNSAKNGNNVPFPLIQIAMRRKSSEPTE